MHGILLLQFLKKQQELIQGPINKLVVVNNSKQWSKSQFKLKFSLKLKSVKNFGIEVIEQGLLPTRTIICKYFHLMESNNDCRYLQHRWKFLGTIVHLHVDSFLCRKWREVLLITGLWRSKIDEFCNFYDRSFHGLKYSAPIYGYTVYVCVSTWLSPS